VANGVRCFVRVSTRLLLVCSWHEPPRVAAWLLAVLGATDGSTATWPSATSGLHRGQDSRSHGRWLVVIGGLIAVAVAGSPVVVRGLDVGREVLVSVLTLVPRGPGRGRVSTCSGGQVSTFALIDGPSLFLLTTNPHHGARRPGNTMPERAVGSWPHGPELSWPRPLATLDRPHALRPDARLDQSCNLSRMQIPDELLYSSDHDGPNVR